VNATPATRLHSMHAPLAGSIGRAARKRSGFVDDPSLGPVSGTKVAARLNVPAVIRSSPSECQQPMRLHDERLTALRERLIEARVRVDFLIATPARTD